MGFELIPNIIQCVIIIGSLIYGFIAHAKMVRRNYAVMFLLLVYVVLTALILMFQLGWEYIPVIYLILICTSTLQLYQFSIFIQNSKDYVQSTTQKRNWIIMAIFAVLYVLLIPIGFWPPIGALCGMNERVYPECFILLLTTNFLFWIFTFYKAKTNFNIDPELIDSEATQQTARLMSEEGVRDSFQKMAEEQEETEIKRNCYGLNPNQTMSWLDMFKFQTRQWECVHTFQQIFAIIILTLANNNRNMQLDGAKDEDLILRCSKDPAIWHTQGTGGGIFIIMHTLIMMTSCMQVRAAFYQVLEKTTYFDSEQPLTDEVFRKLSEKEKKDQTL